MGSFKIEKTCSYYNWIFFFKCPNISIEAVTLVAVGGRQGTCSCCSRDKIRFLWVMTIVGSGHVPSPPNLLLGFPEYLTRATPGGCSWAPGRWSWTKKSVNDCWLLLLRPDLCSAILQPSAITHLIIPAPSTAFWCQLCIRPLRTKRR